jgi:acyl-CoA hydrolase
MAIGVDLNGFGRLIKPGMRVYVTGTAGESQAIFNALQAVAPNLDGVTFVGVWLPGINAVDYAALNQDARATAFFMTSDLRQTFEAGQIGLIPLPYSAIYRFLEQGPPFDLAFLHVSPPDGVGMVSVGVANDFQPAVIANSRRLVAHVNPRMPSTAGAARVSLDEIDATVETETPLLADDPKSDPTWDAIGGHVAELVRDGDTVEIGIGRVQTVWRALAGKKNLSVHSGAISTPFLDLVAAGSIADEERAIVVGIAHGQPALHTFAASDRRVWFAPVGWTHHPSTMAAIDGFVAINSVMEVDLLGQSNAETVAGRQVGGAGGLTDFMRGARLSPGGRSIIALPATARRGTVSKIVPDFGAGLPVSVGRGDVDFVVTEYGVADLRHADIDRRANALCAIAAPDFRDTLSDAWAAKRSTL